MKVEKIFDHISNWNKVWFGLIFLGSVINAVLQKFNLFGDSPYVLVFAFGLTHNQSIPSGAIKVPFVSTAIS